jgi:allantoinase
MNPARPTRKAAPPLRENNFYERKPIVSRSKFTWPNGARIAFGVMVCLEHYELRPPKGAFLPVNLPGAGGRAPYPDVRAYSQRAYGSRVGVFRVMNALEKHGMKATAPIDVSTARNSPELVSKLRQLGWEIAGHGHAITQVISSKMTDVQERKYIRTALDALEDRFGSRPAGWHSPEYGESARTPGLLAELGVKYVADWPNDEQPYRMSTDGGPLISVPVAVDLDDVFAHWHRKISMERWQRAVTEALDQPLADEQRSGRMMLLNLHPWLIGQPWRITFLEALLGDIAKRKDIWLATAGEIAAWADKQL